jgi:hypothetical protein
MDTAVPGVRGSPAAVDAARCVRLRGGASVSPVLSESSETLSESRAADARLVDRAGGARASSADASEESDEDKDVARRPLTADRFCVVEVAFRNETSDRSSDDAESADEDDARDDGGVALGGARRRVLGGGGGGGGGGINRCDG